MITQEALEEAGFKKFTQKNIWHYTDTGWQLCVRDSAGNKKYSITVPEYDNSNYPEIMKYENGNRYSFQPEGQFTTKDCITFNIYMLLHNNNNNTVQDVLDFFENIYYRMNCKACG